MRNHLKLVALCLVTFVGLSACDLLGEDDENGVGWGGLGPGAVGDTLDTDVTIPTQAEFDGDVITTYGAHEHAPGRTFFFRQILRHLIPTVATTLS